MNFLVKISIAISVTVFALISCHSTKKTATTQSVSSETSVTPTPAPSPAPAVETTTASALPVRNGIIPGDLELKAIQAKYPETTAQNLANGHSLYTGTCTDCHRKKNIFAYSESRWKDIIADMARRSKLNATQTDDLYKYVLSMKATQSAYAR